MMGAAQHNPRYKAPSPASLMAYHFVCSTCHVRLLAAGVLTALMSSHDGAAMMVLPELADRVVGEMDRIFPGLAGLAGERVVTDWTNDTDSLGAYACFGPGQLVPAWPLMRRRYGCMVLAGEHTDEWSGYMEGALRSGARASRSILSFR